MISSYVRDLELLVGHPLFELPNCFALCWKLHVRVNGVDVFTARMAHERFADFLHDSRFHEPRIECVAEVVEAVVTDTGAPNGVPPSSLYFVDGTVAEGE